MFLDHEACSDMVRATLHSGLHHSVRFCAPVELVTVSPCLKARSCASLLTTGGRLGGCTIFGRAWPLVASGSTL